MSARCSCRYCCCCRCCAWPRSCSSVPTRGVAHRRSSTMSSATLFLWHDLSQRECVGRVIKCIQQGWKQGSTCAGVQRCHRCAIQQRLRETERDGKRKKHMERQGDRDTKHLCSCANDSQDHNRLPVPRSKQALSRRLQVQH